MKIFSRISATFNKEFTVWLPTCGELQNFIEELSGFEVSATEKDGELSISGSLEEIISIKDSLSNFIKETEQVITSDDDASYEITDLQRNNFTGNDEQHAIDNNISSVEEENEENIDCLNIEVINSNKKGEETVKKAFKFSCSMCSFKSQRESHYQRHINLHKTTSTIYSCDECNFRTLRFTHLRRHQVIHSAKTLTCPTCNYSTDDAKLLHRHQRFKHKIVSSCAEETKAVRNCPACPYQTTRLYLYERHMKVHSAEENKGGPNLFVCSQCDYRTTRKIHHVRHIRDVHRQWRPYLCHLCGKAFKRPDALKQHNLLHATPGEDGSPFPFQCHICSKICHSRAHLKEHQAVHSSERSFLCEICGASFKTRSVQRKHVANLHSNPRAFPCSFCKKRFNTNYALRRHMKQHPSIPNIEESAQENASKLDTIVLPVVPPTTDEPLTVAIKLHQQTEGLLYLAEQSESSSLI